MGKLTPKSTRQVKPQQILLDLMTTKVSEEFNLNEDYVVTGFNSKTATISLMCKNYEIAIKVTGDVKERLMERYAQERAEFEEANQE